jgi:oligopeptide transport system permease protein
MNWIGKKIIHTFLAFWIVMSLTFFLMKAIPGDPFTDEKGLPPEIHLALREHYGLEDSWFIQYTRYLKSIFTGNLGPSFKYPDRTVNEIILSTFPISATLGLEALVLSLGLGVLLGTVAALKQHQWQDRTILLITIVGVSVPSFLLATLMQYFLSLKLGLFPIARWGSFAHTILPAFALASMSIAFIARMTRANMIEILKQDYIKTAKSKGLSSTKIVFRHALRNALIPLLPYFGQLSANILVGSFVIEKIFSIPGLGQWFVTSVYNRDYTVIMGTTVFYSLIFLTSLLLAELLYAQLDPRIKKI